MVTRWAHGDTLCDDDLPCAFFWGGRVLLFLAVRSPGAPSPPAPRSPKAAPKLFLGGGFAVAASPHDECRLHLPVIPLSSIPRLCPSFASSERSGMNGQGCLWFSQGCTIGTKCKTKWTISAPLRLPLQPPIVVTVHPPLPDSDAATHSSLRSAPLPLPIATIATVLQRVRRV